MKHLFLLVSLFMLSILGVSAQMEYHSGFSVKKKANTELKMLIALYSPGTLAIDWGNNASPQLISNVSNLLTVDGSTEIRGIVGEKGEIKINGGDIAYIVLVNQGVNSVDLSRCRSLRYLDLSGNGLETLVLPEAKRLNYIKLENNKLSDATVQDFYKKLGNKKGAAPGFLKLKNNPLNQKIDLSNLNWKVEQN